MNKDFQNIEEYIASQSSQFQHRLRELQQIIEEVIPSETLKTISYKMPTYKYKGNLIHFAQFQHHIGIYPGPDAIEAHKELLINYKTSKGAIQIPNETPLDKSLIQNILLFNIDKLKDKKPQNWEAYREKWNDLYEKMNATISKTLLKKEIKWGMEIYTYEGKNIVGWAGFKNFFSLWFYNGVFLSDPYHVLVSASEGKTKSLRQWRLTDSSQFDEKKIVEYIQESIQTVKDGKFLPAEKNTKKFPEGILKEEIDKNKEMKIAFLKLTPGKQKEYIEYINEAKQEKTKIARLEKIVPMILNHQGLHDKYKRK